MMDAAASEAKKQCHQQIMMSALTADSLTATVQNIMKKLKATEQRLIQDYHAALLAIRSPLKAKILIITCPESSATAVYQPAMMNDGGGILSCFLL